MANNIRVNPAELEAASKKLISISEGYTGIYTQMMRLAQNMGSAWEAADNLAFVEQISGFCEELKKMAAKLELAGTTLHTQAQNYEARQSDNITQVKKLTN